MNFFAYVHRQSSLIRGRREGKSKKSVRSSGELMDELKNIKGLNTAERQYFGSRLSLTK